MAKSMDKRKETKKPKKDSNACKKKNKKQIKKETH